MRGFTDLMRKMNGVFAIDKPLGHSSNNYLNVLKYELDPLSTVQREFGITDKAVLEELRLERKKLGFRLKVGHGGTLDPNATGVLVIALGHGTKALSRYLGCTKEYTVTGELGSATDTLDCEGVVTETAPTAHVTRDLLLNTLDQFRGDILQTPPLYSAVKRGGRPMYEYARAGQPAPALEPRPVTIHDLELTEWVGAGERIPGLPPSFSLRLVCSKGTYVRSIVHDVAVAMDTRAHVVALRRTRQGEWSEANALPRDQWTLPAIAARLRPVDEFGAFLDEQGLAVR
ncbi:pseudouridine synthase pus4 [Blastocladiella emersonii ATCC 22665]|nr:pseudouridine synthase pus4 [Blastocladiella emersonii ATCC 22665]